MMPNKKEMIRLAMLGDHEAQIHCTEERVILSCPCCGGEAGSSFDIAAIDPERPYVCGCFDCDLSVYAKSEEEAIGIWNNRPTPMIGKCKECRHSREPKESDRQEDFYRLDADIFIVCDDALVCETNHIPQLVFPTHFCSNFSPKEK